MLRMSSSATPWMLCVLELRQNPTRHGVSARPGSGLSRSAAPRGCGPHLTTKAAAQTPSVTTDTMAAACAAMQPRGSESCLQTE
jgi:hypothetical protein